MRTLSGAYFYFVCAAALADEVQVFSFVKERKRSEKALRSFLPLICCPARTADKSGSPVSLSETDRPSCQSPPPKAFPALGIHPASGTTSLFLLKRRPMRHNASSFQDYRGIHQFSQRYRLRYAQRRRCSCTCQPFQLRRGKGCSGKVSDPALTSRTAPIATTESYDRAQKEIRNGVSEPF